MAETKQHLDTLVAEGQKTLDTLVAEGILEAQRGNLEAERRAEEAEALAMTDRCARDVIMHHLQVKQNKMIDAST